MTAEVVIMNKEAIALASDSAVTMTAPSGQKIFISANKLFCLTRHQPIGIMVYGNANFMNVPWETIIKVYRSKLAPKPQKKLKQYADNFIDFLNKRNPLFPSRTQEMYMDICINAYCSMIKNMIKKSFSKKIKKEGEITDKQARKIIDGLIEREYALWGKTANIPSIPKSFSKTLIDKYGTRIKRIIRKTLEELPISRNQLRKLTEIISWLFSKFPDHIQIEGTSGIVIAGFGENEIFPSLQSYRVEGIVNNKLKFQKHITAEINDKASATIIPFAQREMVATFIEGIDPYYRLVEESYISEIFDKYLEEVLNILGKYSSGEKSELKKRSVAAKDVILKDFKDKLQTFREKTYVKPITTVVSMLPKNELAALAESLVNITSSKRKFTMEAETVGGPTDVAVISKGDGFIWIKRKHYFSRELNPRYFLNL